MLLAHAQEATPGGPPYFAAHAPRLCDPETRSRVIGYLASAPAPTHGWRTDGSWLWPDSLIESVRSRGVGPRQKFLDEIAARSMMPPATLPPGALDDAVELASRPSAYDEPPRSVSYLAGYTDPSRPPERLIRVARETDGAAVESDLGPYGWVSGDFWREARPRTLRLVQIAGREAADLADRLCGQWHRHFIDTARESDDSAPPRLARVFDGQSPDGAPWFSPSRLRIVEPERRERLASYLAHGRLVVRVTARMADPLSQRTDRVVALSYRTDGAWVWQEALAYYVGTRGLAPELDLLSHIEESGYRSPDVADGIVPLAAEVVRAGRQLRPASSAWSYHLDAASGRLVRAVAGDVWRAELFTSDLRWRPCDDLWRDSRGSRRALGQIPESDAIQQVDRRWAEHTASISA